MQLKLLNLRPISRNEIDRFLNSKFLYPKNENQGPYIVAKKSRIDKYIPAVILIRLYDSIDNIRDLFFNVAL